MRRSAARRAPQARPGRREIGDVRRRATARAGATSVANSSALARSLSALKEMARGDDAAVDLRQHDVHGEVGGARGRGRRRARPPRRTPASITWSTGQSARVEHAGAVSGAAGEGGGVEDRRRAARGDAARASASAAAGSLRLRRRRPVTAKPRAAMRVGQRRRSARYRRPSARSGRRRRARAARAAAALRRCAGVEDPPWPARGSGSRHAAGAARCGSAMKPRHCASIGGAALVEPAPEPAQILDGQRRGRVQPRIVPVVAGHDGEVEAAARAAAAASSSTP